MGVLQVGLDDDAGLELCELVLVEQLAEQLQREVLDVVVLHVEVHEGPAGLRPPQYRAQTRLGLRQTVGAGQRRVRRRQCGRLDAHVHAGEGAEIVALEVIVGRPVWRRFE